MMSFVLNISRFNVSRVHENGLVAICRLSTTQTEGYSNVV